MTDCPDCEGRIYDGCGRLCRTCLGRGRVGEDDPDETGGRELEDEWQTLDSLT
jgi:hypothetical protein